MEKRRLGNSGLSVAPLAFGGNVFGWTADEATSFALLDAFVDAGFNLIDTADVYSRWVPGNEGGEQEQDEGAHGGPGGPVDVAAPEPADTETQCCQGGERAREASASRLQAVERALGAQQRMPRELGDLEP